jgi:hypothetical protein
LSKDDKTINKDYNVNGNFKGINKDMRRIREISIQAEAMYEDAIRLGNHAAYAFKDLSRSKRNSHRSQMTGLENIAESALKTSDIFDYIKKQTARFDYWRKGFPGNQDPNEGFGEALKTFLEGEVKRKRDRICRVLDVGDVTDEDKYKRQQIYLQLIRQFIRHLIVQYEYCASQEEGSENGTNAGANAQNRRYK